MKNNKLLQISKIKYLDKFCIPQTAIALDTINESMEVHNQTQLEIFQTKIRELQSQHAKQYEDSVKEIDKLAKENTELQDKINSLHRDNNQLLTDVAQKEHYRARLAISLENQDKQMTKLQEEHIMLSEENRELKLKNNTLTNVEKQNEALQVRLEVLQRHHVKATQSAGDAIKNMHYYEKENVSLQSKLKEFEVNQHKEILSMNTKYNDQVIHLTKSETCIQMFEKELE